MTIQLINTIRDKQNVFKTVKIYYNAITEEYMIIPCINGFNVFDGYWQYTDTKEQALEKAYTIIKQNKLKP
jgi:hypothetical protein